MFVRHRKQGITFWLSEGVWSHTAIRRWSLFGYNVMRHVCNKVVNKKWLCPNNTEYCFRTYLVPLSSFAQAMDASMGSHTKGDTTIFTERLTECHFRFGLQTSLPVVQGIKLVKQFLLISRERGMYKRRG